MVPKPIDKRASKRHRLAYVLFLGLRFFLKFGFIVGCLVGGLIFGTAGYVYGTIIGGLLGLWIRFSLAYRGGDPTANFFLRMHERSCGDKPRFLESFLERLRGPQLTCYQCRQIVNAYAVMRRALETCQSTLEKNQVLEQFEKDTTLQIQGICL